MVELTFVAAMFIAAFAGGLFGAAIGSLPAFVFTGFAVIAGETAAYVNPEAGAVTDMIAFGAVFGPHIAFAGGAAASAYAAKKGYINDTNWGYHHGKNILVAFGAAHRDVLIVGGLFGMFGYLVFFVSAELLAAPWDPIAMGVVLSAVAHRVVFGYDLVGTKTGDGSGRFDMGPFEREQTYATDGAGGNQVDRLAVEPWLPWQYEWGNVALLGLGAGILGGFIYWATASPFMAFGISAASLVFLNLSTYDNFGDFQVPVPVTHHITLPASTAPMAYAGLEAGANPGDVAGAIGLFEVLALGAVFGILGALAGEAAQRIFYAHGDTHFDPPATSIVFTTFVIAVLAIVGVFPGSGWVPLPF
jgi:hypothetical protein